MRPFNRVKHVALVLPLLASCQGTIGGPGDDEEGGGGISTDGPDLGASAWVCDDTGPGVPVLRRLTAREIDTTLRDVFPALVSGNWTGVRLGTDPSSSRGFDNDAHTLKVGAQTANDLSKTAEDVATILTAPTTLPTWLPCAATAPDANCAGQFIDTYGLRLFRRPLSAEEKADFIGMYNTVSQASDFQHGLKWTIVSMLQSPFAIYRSEIGEVKDGRRQLTQYEIATELAYTFGGGPPSQELLDQAASGALGTEEAVIAEAKKLAETPRGREVLHRFFEEWLQYNKIRGQARDDVQNFADISVHLADETRRFIDEVVVTQQGGFRELLTAPYTFHDATLSQFYGYGGVGSSDYARVDRPAEWSVGVLAQGSMMAANAHPDSSSPTQRGLFVYRRLLCNEVPPPPKDVPAIQHPEPGVTTTRMRYETLHATGGCKACHDNFDPFGFAFEHFDATGRYRADEKGLPIDTATHVKIDKELTQVAGAAELANALAASPEAVLCASKLAATYTYGGVKGSVCGIEPAVKSLEAGEYGIAEFIVRLAGLEHLRYRSIEQ